MEKDMSIARIIAAAAVVSGASTAMAQDVPDPNPIFNPDGTMTWYVGFNTQYPFLQDAIDAAQPGDELVITEGLYVESVEVNTPDLTIRPRVDTSGDWEDVILWNPTEGFENDNDFAIKVSANTNNTYIGRPREFTQLANGTTVDTAIQPGEYNWEGSAGTETEVDSIGVTLNDRVITFWSRSMDNVCVWSDGGQATFNSCYMTGRNGFGGGILCTGDTNTTSFVTCKLEDLNAPGLDMGGYPVNVITMMGGDGMNVMFSDCDVYDCTSGTLGAVYQVGGYCSFDDTNISRNSCYMGNGTVNIVGGSPSFSECEFEENESRYGTVYSDSTGLSRDRITSFLECNFEDNFTEDQTYGGAFFAVDASTGGSPLVHFSRCEVDDNNGASEMTTYDIDTPYFPEYRIGADFDSTSTSGPSTIPGDLNADGVVNGADMGILLGNWGLGG
jgi:hypothetical protein